MNPPPPRFPAAGKTTASANATATAASTALPPRFITSTPICDAIRSVDATIPCGARTGSRHAASTVITQTQRNRRKNHLNAEKKLDVFTAGLAADSCRQLRITTAKPTGAVSKAESSASFFVWISRGVLENIFTAHGQCRRSILDWSLECTF